MNRIHLSLLAAFWCCLGVLAHGQDASRYVCLTLESGMVRCGQLVADDGREVTLQTPDMGKLIVPKVQVVRMVDAAEGTTGSAGSSAIEMSDRMLNPNRSLQATRYFFAPSAHSLKEGEGYASANVLALGNVSYGLTPNLIGGLSVSFLGAGITAKASTELTEGIRGSVGMLYQLWWEGGQVVFPFANVTFGDENNHLTLAGGYLGGQSSRNASPDDRIDSPMFNLSGCVQISDNAWLMTENYVFANPEFFPVNVVGSFGLRLWRPMRGRLFEPAIMFLAFEEEGTRPFPWLSWTWPF